MKRTKTAFVVLAALFWGLSGGVAGILMARGWDLFVVSFYRRAIGLLVVLLWLALRPRRSGLSQPRLWFWSAIAGIGVAGNFTFYFISISQGSIAVAVVMLGTVLLTRACSGVRGLNRPGYTVRRADSSLYRVISFDFVSFI